MQTKNSHTKKYQNVQVSTIDRGRLLLMLYDGCLKFLHHAKDGLEANDYPKFARFLSKAQNIIIELINTLDHEKGGQIATDLDRLYDFMMFYLTEANLERNPAKIQKVINLMEVVTGAFRDVISSGKALEVGDLPSPVTSAPTPAAHPYPTAGNQPKSVATKPATSKADEVTPVPGKGFNVSY